VAPRSEDPKLIIHVINFEIVQPMCSRYVNVTDGRTDRQTDRRTDGRTTYDSNTALALRASRGKNEIQIDPYYSSHHVPVVQDSSFWHDKVYAGIRRGSVESRH